MKFLLNVLIWWIAFAIAAYLAPGVYVDTLRTAIVAGLVLSLVNATIGFLLRILTLPLNILTLGLLGFIVTILMIQLTDGLVDGFNVSGFRTWALFALILGIVQAVFGYKK